MRASCALALLCLAFVLAACGGASAPVRPPAVPLSGSSDPAHHLRTARFTAHQPRVLEQIGAHHAYARGLTGRGVRIAIEDTVVDHTQRGELGDRVRTATADGAVLAYAHPFGDHPVSAAAACAERTGCTVHRRPGAAASGPPNAAVLDLVVGDGWPLDDDAVFVLDDAHPREGPGRLHRWWEVPSPYDFDRPAPAGAHHGAHGTAVASVAAGARFGVAPGATIIPVAVNLVGDQAEASLADVHVHRFIEGLDGAARAALDARTAADLSARYARFDIVNQSYGHPFSASLRADGRERAWLKRHLPRTWRAFLQSERSALERTVLVRAAGNNAQESPEGEAAWPAYEPALRGHMLAVAATDPSTGRIAAYSSRCGALPADWDARADGPHYCLVAPGTVRGLVPDAASPGAGRAAGGLAGTSYAAPVVSGALALLMERFRGLRPPAAVVRRMLDTADRSGVYADASVYGAGHLDLEAALAPVGALTTGVSRAPVRTSTLRAPAAFGDLGARAGGLALAALDADDFPFWVPLSALVGSSAAAPSPIPAPSPGTAPPAPGLDAFGAHWMALGAPGAPWRAGFAPGLASLAARPGAGVSHGVALEHGRYLSGRASGAFGGGLRAGTLWTSRALSRPLGRGLTFDARAMLALGLPRYDAGALFAASPSLLSAFSVALSRGASTVSLSQPLRAETGTGVFRLPSGVSGAPPVAHRVRLAPRARALTAVFRHQLPAFGGALAFEASSTFDAGHVPGAHHRALGLAWRVRW